MVQKFWIGLIACVLAITVWAQDRPPVNESGGPPVEPWSSLNYYDGSNQLIYVCQARSVQPTYIFTIAGSTLTDVAVASNVGTATTASAHGLQVGNSFTIYESTVDTDLNATYVVATVSSTTTFTFTTVDVADATYTDAFMKLSTTAPRSSAANWAIIRYTYTSSNLTAVAWAGGTTADTSICDDRASLDYQ